VPAPSLRILDPASLVGSAGGDPWELQDQLLAGKPGHISTLAQAFHLVGSCTAEAESAFDQARAHLSQGYISSDDTQPFDASRVVDDTRAGMGLSSDSLGKIGIGLEEIAAELADAQQKTHDPIDSLNHCLVQLDSECLAMRHAGHRLLEDNIDDVQSSAAAVVKAVYEQMWNIVNNYDSFLDARMTDIESTGYIPATELDDGVGSVPIPAPNTDPVAVNTWWNTLTTAQQQAVLPAHPDLIGNLNGVPVSYRSAGNEFVMNTDIDRVEDIAARNNVSVDQVEKNAARYGLTADDITRYTNAIHVRAGLAADGTQNSADSGPYPAAPYPTYLFAYQPLALNGKGTAAISIGNPDMASNTAVVVPGASWSVSKDWLVATHSTAQNLYVESNRADPAHPTAVIAWMGYDAPTGATDAMLHGTSRAYSGGQALAQDVNGLWATHQGASHVTLVGHSYGTLVVGDAAATGHMHANDVVLLGPSGTGDATGTVAKFHLDGGNVYVGQASNDDVAQGSQIRLGPGPISSVGGLDGAIRIKAEAPASYDHVAVHSHYFTAGSESLYTMADVVAGHGNRLAADGMLGGRHIIVTRGGVYDDELYRARHSNIQDNHYH
jgi:Alpha/beta hydrolase